MHYLCNIQSILFNMMDIVTRTKEDLLNALKTAVRHRNEAKLRMEEEYSRKGQSVNVVFV